MVAPSAMEARAMTDAALTNAETERNQILERKKKLLAELVEIDDRIGQITRFIDWWHDFAGIERPKPVDNSNDSEENKTVSAHTDRTPRAKNSSKENVAAVALEIIQERGEPVSRSDLYAELTKRGMVIQGKDPEMVLSTMLWRMRHRVARLKSGGYWDAHKDWDPAGYKSEWLDEIEGRERDYEGVDMTGKLFQ